MREDGMHCHCLLADRAIAELEGPDVRKFLQGLVTVDISKLGPERSLYGALLTPQGKILFDFFLSAPGEERILLDVEASRQNELIQRLSMYRLRSRVAIRARAEGWCVVAFPGARPAAFDLPERRGAVRSLAGGMLLVDPRLAALGLRWIGPRERLAEVLAVIGGEEAAPETYLRLRLRQGVAEGSAEMPPGRALPLEYNFEALDAVDFAKGCFVGQEVTARMHYRARPRKRLLPVQLEGRAAPGMVVATAEGRDAGELRAVHDTLGLALLRLELLARPQSHPLECDGARVLPSWPQWLEVEEKNPLQQVSDRI